jgi:hypothetical protein
VTGLQPDTVALVEGVEKIRGSPEIEDPDEENSSFAAQGRESAISELLPSLQRHKAPANARRRYALAQSRAFAVSRSFNAR